MFITEIMHFPPNEETHLIHFLFILELGPDYICIE